MKTYPDSEGKISEGIVSPTRNGVLTRKARATFLGSTHNANFTRKNLIGWNIFAATLENNAWFYLFILFLTNMKY